MEYENGIPEGITVTRLQGKKLNKDFGLKRGSDGTLYSKPVDIPESARPIFPDCEGISLVVYLKPRSAGESGRESGRYYFGIHEHPSVSPETPREAYLCGIPARGGDYLAVARVSPNGDPTALNRLARNITTEKIAELMKIGGLSD